MQIGVSNPNVPIFPPRVCTLVLFIIQVIIIILMFVFFTVPISLVLSPEDFDFFDFGNPSRRA